MKTIITVVIKLFTTARRMGSGIGGGGWSTSIIMMVIITFGSDREATHRMGTGLAVRTRWIWATAFELFHLDTGTEWSGYYHPRNNSNPIRVCVSINYYQGCLSCQALLFHQLAHNRFHRFRRLCVRGQKNERVVGIISYYLPPNKDPTLPVPHPISTYRDLDVVRGIGFIFTENCIRGWLEEKLEKCTIILLNDCGGGGGWPQPHKY